MFYLFVLRILIGNIDISYGYAIFLCLSRCKCCLIMFCNVFCVLNVIFIGVSLKSSIILFISYQVYLKIVKFVFRCCGSVFPDLVYVVFIVVWCAFMRYRKVKVKLSLCLTN
jgi:hypothetical protein